MTVLPLAMIAGPARRSAVAALGPLGQQRRLAEPGRSADQHPTPRQPLADRLHQPRARHKTRRRARHMQLGSQQHILPGGDHPGSGHRRRARHRRPAAHRNQQSSVEPLDAAILRLQAPPLATAMQPVYVIAPSQHHDRGTPFTPATSGQDSARLRTFR
jgi:hypothetical protein